MAQDDFARRLLITMRDVAREVGHPSAYQPTAAALADDGARTRFFRFSARAGAGRTQTSPGG
jgi:hypothetical protein